MTKEFYKELNKKYNEDVVTIRKREYDDLTAKLEEKEKDCEGLTIELRNNFDNCELCKQKYDKHIAELKEENKRFVKITREYQQETVQLTAKLEEKEKEVAQLQSVKSFLLANVKVYTEKIELLQGVIKSSAEYCKTCIYKKGTGILDEQIADLTAKLEAGEREKEGLKSDIIGLNNYAGMKEKAEIALVKEIADLTRQLAEANRKLEESKSMGVFNFWKSKAEKAEAVWTELSTIVACTSPDGHVELEQVKYIQELLKTAEADNKRLRGRLTIIDKCFSRWEERFAGRSQATINELNERAYSAWQAIVSSQAIKAKGQGE
jgi:hypothetical protein